MTTLQALFPMDAQVCAHIAWTLVHFAWIGAVIGLVAMFGGVCLARGSARLRYGWHLTMLVLLAATPLAVFPLAAVETPNNAVAMNPLGDPAPIVVPNDLRENGSAPSPAPIVHPPILDPQTPMAPAVNIVVAPQWGGLSSLNRVVVWAAPWVTGAWAAGALLMLFRLGLALWGGRRLIRAARPADDLSLFAQKLATQLHLAAAPVVCYCERVASPVVLGLVRPTILLPASLATGMTTEELRAIFTHELAHVRRLDLLMNLVQRVIESVLFFHPAVWVISRRVSIERENCCDDFVIANGWQRVDYASALVRMAELCAGLRSPSNAVSLAARGSRTSDFKRRVLRVLQGEPRVRLHGMTMLAMTSVLLLVAAFPLVAQSWASRISSNPRQPDAAPTELADERSEHHIVVADPELDDADNDAPADSLATAVQQVNAMAKERVEAKDQPSLTVKEVLDKINTAIKTGKLSEADVKTLKEIQTSQRLPEKVTLRAFTRYDSGDMFHHVWFVRLILEQESGAVNVVPIRRTVITARPYTQLERSAKHHAAEHGIMLLNRLSGYFDGDPKFTAGTAVSDPKSKVLIASATKALSAETPDEFMSLYEWGKAEKPLRDYLRTEITRVMKGTVDAVTVQPKWYGGEVVHWEGFRTYTPTIPVKGWLRIEFREADDVSKYLWLEMGDHKGAYRLTAYAPNKPDLPRKLPRISTRSHLSPVADGFEMIWSNTPQEVVISAKLSNEEVWKLNPTGKIPDVFTVKHKRDKPAATPPKEDDAATPPTHSNLNRSKVVDVDGNPVVGAALWIPASTRRDETERIAEMKTDARGEFTYPANTPAGRFFLHASADGYLPKRWIGNSQVYRQESGKRQPDRLVLRKPVTVEGRIFGVDGAPLADAEIAVDYFEENGSACINCIRVKSDKEGRFEADNVPPGNVIVRYESPYSEGAARMPVGVQPAKLSFAHFKSVDGATMKGIELKVAQSQCVVEGVIVDHVGNGVENRWIQATLAAAKGRLDESVTVKTDADGRFRFTGLPPEEFVVGTYTPGFNRTVTAKLDAATTVRLTTYIEGIKPMAEHDKLVWGTPNERGLVTAIAVEPVKDRYEFGDAISIHVLARNTSKENQLLNYTFSAETEVRISGLPGDDTQNINYALFSGIPAPATYLLAPGTEVTLGGFRIVLTDPKATDTTTPTGAHFHVPCAVGTDLSLVGAVSINAMGYAEEPKHAQKLEFTGATKLRIGG